MTRVSGTKKTGVVRGIRDLIEAPNAGKLWAKVSLLAIVNPALSNADLRLLSLVAVPGLGSGRAVVSAAEAAEALRWAEKTVRRSMNRLVRLGVVAVAREPGKANAYVIRSEVFETLPRETKTARVMKEKALLVRCVKCGRLCVAGKTGWCRKCAGRAETEGIARRVARETARLVVEEKLAGAG